PELGGRRQAQDCEREADRAQSRSRALDAVVYQAVRVAVGSLTAFVVAVALSPVRMSVRAEMRMPVDAQPVAVQIPAQRLISRAWRGHDSRLALRSAGIEAHVVTAFRPKRSFPYRRLGAARP